MTIIEFLEARLAEDEQLAHESHSILLLIGNDTRVLVEGSDERNTYRFIERFNPARVLREVAAKRALIKSTVKRIEEGWGYHDNEGIICADLRPMAEIYSEHPDFASIDWE
ncbi:hypothetical protein CH305_18350 [Rhodococcus sp. 15-649-2-2]|uniref:DUF6221 family protein n=1 Tax=Rhodococcus sp. 15-649-2-2 TaxID=2023140 RepID=UPI000B9C139F|nr:DUF6221 family protein [Rhodococcus sp. 15-649-2-2]OZE77199.1 hypothetical protein CH305_18350 [Rhodococcus sp. 15-649-2-2]